MIARSGYPLVQLLDRYGGPNGERHCLVVGDKAENRELLRRALEAEGWSVSQAEKGRVALDQLEQLLAQIADTEG